MGKISRLLLVVEQLHSIILRLRSLIRKLEFNSKSSSSWLEFHRLSFRSTRSIRST